jgi:hypothetical protein
MLAAHLAEGDQFRTRSAVQARCGNLSWTFRAESERELDSIKSRI